MSFLRGRAAGRFVLVALLAGGCSVDYGALRGHRALDARDDASEGGAEVPDAGSDVVDGAAVLDGTAGLDVAADGGPEPDLGPLDATDAPPDSAPALDLAPPDAAPQFAARRSITVDRGQVGDLATTTPSSFPLLFSATDPAFRTTQNGGPATFYTLGPEEPSPSP